MKNKTSQVGTKSYFEDDSPTSDQQTRINEINEVIQAAAKKHAIRDANAWFEANITGLERLMRELAERQRRFNDPNEEVSKSMLFNWSINDVENLMRNFNFARAACIQEAVTKFLD